MEEATKVGIVYKPVKDLEESKEMKAIQQLMLTAQQLQSRLKKLWEIANRGLNPLSGRNVASDNTG